jgi:hypothetical protein
MTTDETFNFTIPKLQKGECISAKEAERLLQEKLEKCESECLDELWDLAYFYSMTGRQPIALRYLNVLSQAPMIPRNTRELIWVWGNSWSR